MERPPGAMDPRGLHRLLHAIWFRRVHADLARRLAPRAGERLLDVGCGTGALARRLARRGAGVTAVDPDPRAVAVATARDPGGTVAFLVAAAEGLPLADGSVDAAVTSVSAHHWADVDRGLREVARVLRPGGRLVMAELGPGRGHRGGHPDARDAGAWRGALLDAGFRDVAVAGGWRIVQPTLVIEARRAAGRPGPVSRGR